MPLHVLGKGTKYLPVFLENINDQFLFVPFCFYSQVMEKPFDTYTKTGSVLICRGVAGAAGIVDFYHKLAVKQENCRKVTFPRAQLRKIHAGLILAVLELRASALSSRATLVIRAYYLKSPFPTCFDRLAHFTADNLNLLHLHFITSAFLDFAVIAIQCYPVARKAQC